MLWVPQKGQPLRQHNTGAIGTATPGTSVTTGATAATKGTAAQLIAATAFDAYWVTVLAWNYGASALASEGCLDILTGAATEEVLIPNLLMGNAGSVAVAGRTAKRWDFPLYIPAGSRLAARAAGARVSTAMRVGIYLFGGNGVPPFRVGTKVTTYGMGAVPRGTTVTPGGTGAVGAWAQITAATSEDHFCLVPSFQKATGTVMNIRTFNISMGVGAATEEVVADGYWFYTDSLEAMGGPEPSEPCFVDVPNGARLVMRASNSGANDAPYDGLIHALS